MTTSQLNLMEKPWKRWVTSWYQRVVVAGGPETTLLYNDISAPQSLPPEMWGSFFTLLPNLLPIHRQQQNPLRLTAEAFPVPSKYSPQSIYAPIHTTIVWNLRIWMPQGNLLWSSIDMIENWVRTISLRLQLCRPDPDSLTDSGQNKLQWSINGSTKVWTI